MDRPPHHPRFDRVVEVPSGHDPAEPERRTPATGYLLDDAPVTLLADLLLPPHRPPAEATGAERSGARAGPSVLMPRHAVVPFLGRTAELADLHMWISDPLPLSIAVVSGRGGAGKTRLAMKLCEDLSRAGWDTGLLPVHALGSALSSPAARLDALRPTLLVIDRPEPYAVVIGELIRRLAGHGANPRSRVLLLPRESPDDDWWPRLTAATGGRRHHQLLAQPLLLQLDRHPLTPAERIEHVRAAMKAFAPDRPDLPDPPPLDAPEYGRPLHVHVAALLRLRGDAPGSRLLSHLLAGEQEHWSRTWPTTRSPLGHQPAERELTGQDPIDGVTARQAVALVTLTAPTPDELYELLAAVPGLLSPGRRLAVTGWLSELLPGDERLSPLGPDLLAEQLLAETEGLDSLVLAVHDHGLRTSGHLVRMLETLFQASGRPTARSALHTLLVSRCAALVREAAANPDTRLGDLLDAALHLLREDRRVAEAVTALPPWPDTPGDPSAPVAGPPWSGAAGGVVPWGGGRLGLRGLEVTSSEIRVGRLRGRSDRMGLAEALSGLAARLAAVGRLDEAVGVAGEAVEIYAAAPPYEQASRHAGALFTLAASLLLAGEPAIAVKPAQEAAARFRILAEDDPRFAAQAERAHYNLACALVSIGRLGEAVAAFSAAGGDAELAEHLEGVLPVLTRTSGGALWPAPLPPLAPLGAGARAELGARLAVAAAVTVAGSATTSQDVAHHLAALATLLDEQDRTEEAVVPATEAVRRLRGLAPEDPGLRLELAETAGLLAQLHARLDDFATGADFAREAADNLRALATLEPGRHLHSLVWQLLDLGEYLLAEDRPEDALPSLQQAAYLAAGLGDNHRRARARADRLLGLCDGVRRDTSGAGFALLASPVPDIEAATPSTDAPEDVGAASSYVRALEVVPLPPNEIMETLLRDPDLATLEWAITLLDHEARQTQAHLGEAGEVALARALALGAAALLGQGRVVEALAHAERAADLCDELDEPVTAATAYVHLGATLAALDRPRAALEAVSWSLAEQERALSGRPDLVSVLLPLRARADQVRGLVLRGLGRRHEGLAHLVRALEAFRTSPRSPAQSLLEAEVATVLVDDLLEDGRAGEAIGYAEVAVDGFADFRRAGPKSESFADGNGAGLKEVLARQRLVRCLLLLGRLQEAGPLVEELVEVARRSPGDLTYRALLADSLAQSAELLPLLELDDGSESEARAREAIWLYDELLDEGVDAEGVHTGRAGAYLSLASALALQGREAEAVQPLREVVAALERFARGHPVLTGYLARAILMLSDALLATGRALEASVVLHRGTQVIEDELLSAVAHAQLGFCQMELRRDDAADEALQVAERLLRHLLDRGGDEDLVHMLREVLRGRLDVLVRAGRSDEADQVERDLAGLRRFTDRRSRPPGPAGRGALPSSPR
ncbi:hypothetical protein ABZ297_14915 [Nonomuraea sp. NPDC005983]|uniref:tetratricopeptide repeat protein n=1 Tax=Nonomuraea sp. NPDC005983 TaxID=3155595 RepID=UPI0033BA9B84